MTIEDRLAMQIGKLVIQMESFAVQVEELKARNAELENKLKSEGEADKPSDG